MNKILILYYLLSCLIFISCRFSLADYPVTITKTYFINPNWSKKGSHNSVVIVKMINKDTSNPIDLKILEPRSLLGKLVEDTLNDSTHSWVADIKYNGKKFSKRKIFFNKYNGFTWRRCCPIMKREILGDLQIETWYEFKRLSNTRHFVYIDSNKTLHQYSVTPHTNW